MRRPAPRLFIALLACIAMAASSPAAHAQDGAAALGLGLDAVVSGKKKPAIILRPTEPIKSVSVTLTGDDGSTQTLKTKRVRAGATKRLTIKQDVGRVSWTAAFLVLFKDGTKSEFTTEFATTRMGKLTLSIKPGDVDMDTRTLSFSITNPAASVELLILGERGRRIERVEAHYSNAKPGDRMTLSWPMVKEDIIRMDLKVTDIGGFWTGMQITPFSIEIPHEEVVFASGKAAVDAAEAPKLEATLGHIQKALDAHGTLLQLKLFVAGYTDTVGSAGSNMALSNQRARAIARWFRSKGVKISIFYAGFGESILAKKTPDETNEPANRRALYILSSQTPAGGQVPKTTWHKL